MLIKNESNETIEIRAKIKIPVEVKNKIDLYCEMIGMDFNSFIGKTAQYVVERDKEFKSKLRAKYENNPTKSEVKTEKR